MKMNITERILKQFKEREDSNLEKARFYADSHNLEEAILHLRLASTWKLAIELIEKEVINEKQKGVEIRVGDIMTTTGTVNFPGLCKCGCIKGSLPVCGRTDCNQPINL